MQEQEHAIGTKRSYSIGFIAALHLAQAIACCSWPCAASGTCGKLGDRAAGCDVQVRNVRNRGTGTGARRDRSVRELISWLRAESPDTALGADRGCASSSLGSDGRWAASACYESALINALHGQ